MYKNYIKIAFRNLKAHKLFSFINIFGLAVGIACFLIITAYVYREVNYDNFHKNKQSIYRVYRVANDPSGKVSSSATPHALPNALELEFPQIKNVVSILSSRESELKVGEKKFNEKLLFASPNFFDVFDFPLEIGTHTQLLTNLNSILISNKLAKKLFGEKSPLGEKITIQEQFEFFVSGILENIPSNSNFQFDAFISDEVVYKYMWPGEQQKWHSMGVETFVELPSNYPPESLTTQFPQLLDRYLPNFLKGKMELGLQPLDEIHNSAEIISYTFPSTSRITLVIFFIIACTILSIASINFVNLSIARYTERKKEIGIRNIIGANKYQIIQQFLFESIIITLLALAVSYLLLQIMVPYFNGYIQKPLRLDLYNHANFILLSFLFAIVLGLINGLYPAYILTKNNSINILRNENNKLFGYVPLKHILVTIQFGITIALIFCVISISNQISFMKNSNLGFNSKNILTIPTNTHSTKKVDNQKVQLYTEILQNEGPGYGIVSAAFSENIPGSYFPNQFEVVPEGASEDDKKEIVITRSVSSDFFNTFQMKFIKGRNFSKSMSTDLSEGAIINETAAEILGWAEPIGKRFSFGFNSKLFSVIGVIKDIHFKSLQNKIEPLLFIPMWGNKNFVSVRVDNKNIKKTIKYLKTKWSEILPEYPFKYDFIEDMYYKSYKEEEQLLQAIATFAILAIGLATLGLLGLSALLAYQRRKEIGIRKVLGASSSNIILRMSKEFGIWIVTANLIAQPIAFYFINEWLQNYPYKINIGWDTAFLSGGIAFSIAFIAIAYQTAKTANTNPIDSLRSE